MSNEQPRPFPELEILARLFLVLGVMLIGGGVMQLMFSMGSLEWAGGVVGETPLGNVTGARGWITTQVIWQALIPAVVGFVLLAGSGALRVVREVGIYYRRANWSA